MYRSNSVRGGQGRGRNFSVLQHATQILVCCGMLRHASKPPPTGPKNRCCGMLRDASTVGAWTAPKIGKKYFIFAICFLQNSVLQLSQKFFIFAFFFCVWPPLGGGGGYVSFILVPLKRTRGTLDSGLQSIPTGTQVWISWSLGTQMWISWSLGLQSIAHTWHHQPRPRALAQKCSLQKHRTKISCHSRQ